MEPLKKEIISCILTDNLEQASKLLAKSNHSDLIELSNLLKLTPRSHIPLKEWDSPFPKFITTSVSYTCGIGCEMCNAGFANTTSLFEDYKYLTLEEFEALTPWLEKASHVALVGLGETLDSPHLEIFLEKLKEKITFISTSGVPLNKKVIEKLIHHQLHYLNLSFDGKTTAGHGGGRDSYTNKFWEKVELIQNTKQALNVLHPIVHLTIAVDSENINQLDKILESAKAHNITSVDLIYMVPHNHSLYEKSVFNDLEKNQEKINQVMKKWNETGVHVRFFEKPQLEFSPETCYFVDKHLMFNLNREKPDLCCGSLDMPLEIDGLSPDEYWNSFPFRYFRSLHFSGTAKDLPEVCRTCWVLNPEELNRTSNGDNFSNKNHLKLYRQAGQSKLKNEIEKAETLYQKIIQSSQDRQLVGKSWFHLGELSLKKNQPEEALERMKNAVRFCFNHTLAFAFLALLMRCVEHIESPIRNQEPDLEFIDFFQPTILAKVKETTVLQYE
jgi:MoaA/NifB/PqqE/SkfB family radical SAM enzyme